MPQPPRSFSRSAALLLVLVLGAIVLLEADRRPSPQPKVTATETRIAATAGTGHANKAQPGAKALPMRLDTLPEPLAAPAPLPATGADTVTANAAWEQKLRAVPPSWRVEVERILSKNPALHADHAAIQIGPDGRLIYHCALHPETALESTAASSATSAGPIMPSGPVTAAAPVPISLPPVRHSRPESPWIIYLDFNGETIVGTHWNETLNRSTIAARAFDLDGNSATFSDTEQAVIIETWQRVAELFEPFDVNVTTVEPARFTGYAMRVIVTSRTDANGATMPTGTGITSTGGIAVVGSFGSPDPCFAYHDIVGTALARVVAHEVGHTLNLAHDRTRGDPNNTGSNQYYSGHGTGPTSWVPIMGSGGRTLSHWSKGDFYDSANDQDDLAIMAQRLGYRTDDHGATPADATPVNGHAGKLSATGTIERESDADMFSFETEGGEVSFTALPFRVPGTASGGSLDLRLDLLDANGNILATDNPAQATFATVSARVNAGRLYLRIVPVGSGDPLANPPSGYTRYGSLGQYTLTGSIAVSAPKIAGPLQATAVLGREFSYRIEASNYPRDFSATGLPSGFSLNPVTGVIRGTATAAGSATVTVTAANAGGSGSAVLTLAMAASAAPVFLSAPADRSVTPGVSAYFSASATGTPEPTYRWERQPAGSTSWSPLSDGAAYSGTATSSLSVLRPAPAMSGDKFRCIASNGTGPVATGSSATLTVLPFYFFSPYAGGSAGSTDGPVGTARFNDPRGSAIDAQGNLFVADWRNHTVRRITPGGVVSTLAGVAGQSGTADGTGSAARFYFPADVACDSVGNIYVADSFNNTVRKITPGGTVSTLAGRGGEWGSADGAGSAARFNRPEGLVVDASGNVLVCDTGNSTIRKIAPTGNVSTLAGQADAKGAMDGQGSAARFYVPVGPALDAAGNLYVADTGMIRKITPSGSVSTFAGADASRGIGGGNIDGDLATARFSSPNDLVFDATGNLYVIDSAGLRKIAPAGSVSTVANLHGVSVVIDATGTFFAVDEHTVRRSTPADGTSFLILSGQPQSQTVLAGAPLTLSVTAASDKEPLSYQWLRNGQSAVHPDALKSTMTLGQADISHNGIYTVKISSAAGIVWSEPATVTVTASAVAFTAQPADRIAAPGYPARFVARPVGTPALQWQRLTAGSGTWSALTETGDGFAGTNSATLVVRSPSAAMHGDRFRCVASGPGGTATSYEATLLIAAVPAISSPPADAAARTGTTATFAVTTTDAAGLSYQWQRLPAGSSTWTALTDSAVYSGTDTRQLSVRGVTAAMSGDRFRVVVASAGGVVTSAPATLEDSGNGAPRISTQPASQSVAAGGAVTFSVVASPAPISYQWLKNGSLISGATGPTLTLPRVQTSDAGNYQVIVRGVGADTVSAGAVLTVLSGARIANLSIRSTAGTGDDTLIMGFVVSGGNKPLLLRGIGPGLAQFGLAGTLADPRLTLFAGATEAAANDDWGAAPNAAQITATSATLGAFALPAGSRDSALLTSVDAGGYTAQLTGGNNGSGIALVELYDAASAAGARFTNASARTQVGAGPDILIAGFSLQGSGPMLVLVRGIGPGLAQFGVGGTLSDPQVSVFSGATVVASNDNWGSPVSTRLDPGAAAARLGAFALPAGSRDAALVAELPPGAYTVQVSGAGNGTGVALVEIYEVP